MKAIAAILPFATDGMLIVSILRGLRERGFDATVVIAHSSAGAYPTDDLVDFAANGRLVNLSKHERNTWKDVLCSIIRDNGVSVVVQNGAMDVYPILPYVKQQYPELAIVDLLYNPIGHTIDHFLYERCMEGVIVESRWMEKYIRKSSEIENRSVWVLESGISLKTFRANTGRVNRGRLEVGFVGRFSHEKNPAGFLQLAAELLRKDENLSFWMFGFGPLEGTLRTQSAKLVSSGRFKFVGYVEDPRTAFAGLDVLVVPSIDDGRPVAVMEAAASGVVVVASPVGGLPEMIVEGETGFIVPPGETERIGQILKSMHDDEVLVRLKKQARAQAEAEFSRERMLDRYEQVFDELVSVRGMRADTAAV